LVIAKAASATHQQPKHHFAAISQYRSEQNIILAPIASAAAAFILRDTTV
jgi:hypothetical protein